MKRYLYSLLAICGIVVFVVIALAALRFHTVNAIDWRLPQEKHILFMGASHPHRGICDSLTSSAINLAYSSERYMYTYIKLQHLIPANSQIDTIFLQCSSTDLCEYTDWKYHVANEQSFFIANYWPLFRSEHWEVFRGETFQILPLILQGLLRPKTFFSSKNKKAILGAYIGCNDNRQIIDTAKIVSTIGTADTSYGHKVNYRYLRKIIDCCRDNNIKLYLVYYPVWHPELFYDQRYCDSIRRTLFSDVEFLDYSDWPCNLGERYDAHHLNHKGAVRLTKELKARFKFE